jgi:DNA-binding transcriptional regulator YiaG
MRRCEKCGGLFERYTKPEHTEDLGGIIVKLLGAVLATRCSTCESEETAIPDLDGLMYATAISRALIPACLKGSEVRFMRRALDMTQPAFAEAMEVRDETISRWENDHPGTGTMTEKSLRHNVCALLYKRAIGRAYDPELITRMRIVPHPAEGLPPLVMRRVHVKQSDHDLKDAWDEAPLRQAVG